MKIPRKFIKDGKFSMPKYSNKTDPDLKISKPSGKSVPYSSDVGKIWTEGGYMLRRVAKKIAKHITKPYRAKIKRGVKKAKRKGIIDVKKQKYFDERVRKGLPI